jgi:cell division protein FtsN
VAKIRRRAKSQTKKPAISPAMIAAVVGAAILIVGGLILIGNQGQPGSGSASKVEYPTLGNPDAAVVVEDFSDFG